MSANCCGDGVPSRAAPTSGCCGSGAPRPAHAHDVSWVAGVVPSPIGPIPRARTAWTRADQRGQIAARLGVGRMRYTVPPGLYAAGDPTAESPVFVSANYKLSFDHLRRALCGIDGWILVLDTRGVNVWCAAGKGTFGTAELVARIRACRLAEIVTHRRVIVPQLGAPGVAVHELRQESAFRVVFGPVRAQDIPAFLAGGLQATAPMRRVRFDLRDRLVLVPIELAEWAKLVFPLAALLFLAGGMHRGGYGLALAADRGLRAALLVLGAWLAGAVLIPVLLPWLPGRALSVKGAVLGLGLALAAIFSGWIPRGMGLEGVAWLLLAPAVAAFQAMNFTGATTYTSLSGVKREMRIAVPAQIAAAVLGLIAWVASLLGA